VDAKHKIFVHTLPTQPFISKKSIMDICGPDTDLKILEIDNIFHNEKAYMKVGLRVLQIKNGKKNKLFSIKDTGGIASGKFANEGKNLLLSVKPQDNTKLNFREIIMAENREADEWPNFSPSNISRTEANFIAFSPDKKKFIAAAPANINGREGWSVDIWDYEKKKLLATEKVISSVYYFLAWTNNREYASWQGYEGKEGIVFTKVDEAGGIEKTYNEAMSKIVIEKATTGEETKIKLSTQPYTKDIILIVNNFRHDYYDSVSGWDAATKEKTFMFDKKGIAIIHAFFPNATEMILLAEEQLLAKEIITYSSSLVISVNTANGEIKRFINIIGKPKKIQWATKDISRYRGQGDKPDNKISKKYEIYAPLYQVIYMPTYCADISASKIFLSDSESGILDIKDFGIRIGEKK
jgi:hypothetical protein